MKAYYVPYDRGFYGSVDEAVAKAVKKMAHRGDEMLGVPVVQSKYRSYSEGVYYIKIAVYNKLSQRMSVRKRMLKVVEIEPVNVQPVERYGCL